MTAAFNKNILARLNRELDADFDLDAFRHVALWNKRCSRMEIYLESACAQQVFLPALDMDVGFAAGERIHTENSYKYTMEMIETILHESGFKLEQSWHDRQKVVWSASGESVNTILCDLSAIYVPLQLMFTFRRRRISVR